MKDTSKVNDLSLSTLFDELITPILESCAQTDARRANAKHSALDALKSGFAVFNLKAPSLFAFRPKLDNEMANLKSLYRINKIPSDNGLRNILDQLDSGSLNAGFSRVKPYLDKHGQLDRYKFWNGYQVYSIDGVQHLCSNKVQCPLCLTRNHRNGTSSYSHSMLTTALVCPDQAEVFVVDNEPILRQDGEKKNDCERNAAKRLLSRISGVSSKESIVYVMDALYACAPIVSQIAEGGSDWKYVINAKEKGNKYLFEQFDELNDVGKVKWKTKTFRKEKYEIGYVNNLSINKSNPEVKCNLLYCRYKPKNKPEIIFSWITNIELSAINIIPVMRMGRSRWKIENEVFNTLKNQEYNYNHNFGHGKDNLATNFAYLMMLAFTVDQIRQRCSRTFKRVVKVLLTRVKLWDVCRSIFITTRCSNLSDFEHKLLILCSLKRPPKLN